MLYPLDDTIVAISSPPGGAARGIVRLSGPGVLACVGQVFQPGEAIELSALRVPTAVPGEAALPGVHSRLPCELYLWPGPRSYTGQPVAEFHTLGSPPLLESLVAALCRAGARLAQPGEFTLRAFLSGRLELTRAEAVLGVIDAADPRELDVALAQLAGGLSRPLEQLRDLLLDMLAHLEAGFDFADEEIAFITPEELDRQLAEASETVTRLAAQMISRTETADLCRVVLVGWPNTGKSSLFNLLAGGPRALVSEQPGTTRDYLTAPLDLDGVGCLLVDTAGIDEAQRGEDVSAAAQSAASEQARQAHVQIFCLDSSRVLNDWEAAQLLVAFRSAKVASADGEEDASGATFAERKATMSGRILVLTKADMPRRLTADLPAVETSSRSGMGVEALRSRIRSAVLEARSGGVSGDVVASTAARCRQSLRLAADALGRAREVLQAGAGEELAAAEIRVALEELGKVVGAVYTDDVLDRVFSRFCIGK